MSKIRTSLKGIIFLFVIVLVIAGIVFAILYFPKKPEKIKYALNEQSQVVLSEDGDFMKNLNAYRQSASDFLDENPNYSSVFYVFDSLGDYMDFTSYVFESADFSNYEKSDINLISNNLNSARITADRVSNYLKDKNVSVTKKIGDDYVYENAEAELVFENIKADIESMFKFYANAMEALARVYKNNVTKGIYANDFAYITIDSAQYYVQYFSDNFKDFDSTDFRFMIINFGKLTTNYLKDRALILQYNTSTSLKDKVKQIVEMPNKISEVSLGRIVRDKLNFDVSGLSEENKAVVGLATTFLKGGLAA